MRATGTAKEKVHMARKSKLKNKKFLIFFYGEPNSGKSSRLKELGKLLLPECETYSESRITTNYKGKKISSPDRNIIGVWNGCTVGIRTLGDIIGEVERSISEFVNNNSSIAIMASHWNNSDFKKKCSARVITQINGFEPVDIPSIKRCSDTSRGDACYTTARELYMHLLHLVTTGSFK